MRFLANENLPRASITALRASGHDVVWVRETSPGCGVVLFRMPMPRSQETGARLTKLINARDDWAGHFSVIEAGRVRMRKLPQ